MKKLLILFLFAVGLWLALASFGGLATQGKYDSLVIDLREDRVSSELNGQTEPGLERDLERQLQAIAGQYNLKPRLNSKFSRSDHIFIVDGDAALLARLRQSELGKLSEYIEPNYVYSTSFVPNDPLYSKQWNLRNINVEAAWETSKGQGVTVAVIDTGISPVEDLKNTKFVKGYDFVNDREQALDDNGHGTHVAGTIAESTNNQFGVAGIAYEASLMPLKVLSSFGGGTVADIAEAIRFAADNGANVINMSLGGGGESSIMKEAINYANQKGAVIIAAAGNSGSNAAAYPARYPHVIGVSATAPSNAKAPYSNYGAGVDIAAPGGAIAGEDRSGGILQNTIDPRTNQSVFSSFQGTSMAAPHVAGVAALIEAAGIKKPDEVLSILQQSARKVEDDGLNYFGAGNLDAAEAVKLASQGQIGFKDFFRWLRDNGYLNPRFWIDGGVVALIPKLLMIIASYLFAWLLRRWFPFRWNWSFTGGLLLGSVGLFFLRGFYVFDLPQWPFRLMGSSLPELGGAIAGSQVLNPFFASVLLPLILVLCLLGHKDGKWFAIGTAIGVAGCLGVSTVLAPALTWLGDGFAARSFLAINALLCVKLAQLAIKTEVAPT